MRSWHHTDPKTGLVLLGVDGPMSYHEWERDLRAEISRSHPQVRRILSDRRRLYPASSAEFLARCIDFLKKEVALIGRAKWAVLSTDRNAVYGSARMVEIMAEETTVQIEAFIDLEASLTWLLPEDGAGEVERLAAWVERAAGAGRGGTDTSSILN